MNSWNNNIMPSCTKQERRKKAAKLGQGIDKTFGNIPINIQLFCVKQNPPNETAWIGDNVHGLSKEETRKEKNSEEDKYIYYNIKHAKNEANDTNMKKRMGPMMHK